MRHESQLIFEYDSPSLARRVERAIEPEVGDIDDDRSQTTLDRDEAIVTVTVEAADLVALRAGLNTWLSLIAVAERAGGVPSAH